MGKEEWVRSKTVEASNDNQPIRSYQDEGSKTDRKIANQVSPMPINHVINSYASCQSGPARFITWTIRVGLKSASWPLTGMRWAVRWPLEGVEAVGWPLEVDN